MGLPGSGPPIFTKRCGIFFGLEMSERSLNAFNTHNHAGRWAFHGRVRLKPNEAAMRPIRSAQHESSMTAPAGAGVVGA